MLGFALLKRQVLQLPEPPVRPWRLPLGEVLMPAAGCANGGSLRTLREAAEASTDNSGQRTGSPTYT